MAKNIFTVFTDTKETDKVKGRIMNRIAKTAIVNSYRELTGSLERPSFIDGAFARKSGNWSVTYKKNNINGFVYKDGTIRHNDLSVRVSPEGKVKMTSVKAFLMGKRALNKIGNMLDSINKGIVNPKRGQAKEEYITINLESCKMV